MTATSEQVSELSVSKWHQQDQTYYTVNMHNMSRLKISLQQCYEKPRLYVKKASINPVTCYVNTQQCMVPQCFNTAGIRYSYRGLKLKQLDC